MIQLLSSDSIQTQFDALSNLFNEVNDLMRTADIMKCHTSHGCAQFREVYSCVAAVLGSKVFKHQFSNLLRPTTPDISLIRAVTVIMGLEIAMGRLLEKSVEYTERDYSDVGCQNALSKGKFTSLFIHELVELVDHRSKEIAQKSAMIIRDFSGLLDPFVDSISQLSGVGFQDLKAKCWTYMLKLIFKLQPAEIEPMLTWMNQTVNSQLVGGAWSRPRFILTDVEQFRLLLDHLKSLEAIKCEKVIEMLHLQLVYNRSGLVNAMSEFKPADGYLDEFIHCYRVLIERDNRSTEALHRVMTLYCDNGLNATRSGWLELARLELISYLSRFPGEWGESPEQIEEVSQVILEFFTKKLDNFNFKASELFGFIEKICTSDSPAFGSSELTFYNQMMQVIDNSAAGSSDISIPQPTQEDRSILVCEKSDPTLWCEAPRLDGAAVREDKGTDVLPETDALTPDILIRMMDSIVLNQRGVGETDQRSRFEALVKEENITWPVFLNSEVIRVFGEVLLWAVRFKHVAFLQKCMPILMYLKKSSDRVPGETQEIVAACLSKKEEINDRVVKDPVESSHALRTAPAPAAHSTDRGVEVQVPSVVLTLFEQTNSDTAPVNALGGYLECKNENIPEVDHQP